MAARKRHSSESFKGYRKSLIIEAKARKKKLKGKLVWDSSVLGTMKRRS